MEIRFQDLEILLTIQLYLIILPHDKAIAYKPSLDTV